MGIRNPGPSSHSHFLASPACCLALLHLLLSHSFSCTLSGLTCSFSSFPACFQVCLLVFLPLISYAPPFPFSPCPFPFCPFSTSSFLILILFSLFFLPLFVLPFPFFPFFPFSNPSFPFPVLLIRIRDPVTF
jgi:hypothetical protein